MPRCTIRGCPVTQSYWRLQVGKTPSFEVLLKPAASYLEAITTTAQVTSNAADVVLSTAQAIEEPSFVSIGGVFLAAIPFVPGGEEGVRQGRGHRDGR